MEDKKRKRSGKIVDAVVFFSMALWGSLCICFLKPTTAVITTIVGLIIITYIGIWVHAKVMRIKR